MIKLRNYKYILLSILRAYDNAWQVVLSKKEKCCFEGDTIAQMFTLNDEVSLQIYDPSKKGHIYIRGTCNI